MDESVSTTHHNTDRIECVNTMEDLPTEMLWEVFSYLNLEDLVSVCSVSRRWKDVGNGVPLMTLHQYIITSKQDSSQVVRTLTSIPNVKNIKIRCSVSSVVDSVLKLIKELCNDVRSLDIDKRIWVKSTLLQDIIMKFPNMESLSASLDFRTKAFMKKIGYALELQTLVISDSFCSTCSYIDLTPIAGGCPSLIHLDLRHCDYKSHDFIRLLRRKKNLIQSLQFTGENFDPETVPPLSECKNLEHIACDHFSSSELPLGVFLDEISSLCGLKRLGLRLCEDICEDDLKKLSKCSFSSTLTALDLKCSNANQELTRIITSCLPKIRKLYVEELGESVMSVLQELLSLEELQHIEIVGWRASRCWFEKLLECKHIKSVVLQDIPSLSEDYCLELVQNMKLQYLKITECCLLTNRFLQLFPYCETLKELYICVMDPSEQSVQELKSRQPSTRIDVHNYLDNP